MKLYIDIDGVLLNYGDDSRAKHSIEFIDYVTSEFDCYWLTTHCKGDSTPAIEYLSRYFPLETVEKLKSIKPTYWEDLKTEGIDFDSSFIWLDDYPFQAEIAVLGNFGASESLYRVNLANEDELLKVMEHLRGIKERKRKRIRRVVWAILTIIMSLLLCKLIWTFVAVRSIGTFESEKKELLQRRDFLIDKIITEPASLIAEMPDAVGSQFQGEWALYSCSMLSTSLVNMSYIYPDTKEKAIEYIEKLIEIVISPEIRAYDTDRWYEDPLETLDGDISHISYISHLAWMIGGYKQIGGGKAYDNLYHSLCEAMNRRILQSPNLNLETYPGELIYVPDMLVAIVALDRYSKLYRGKYSTTVHQWIENVRQNYIDKDSGMITSFISYEEMGYNTLPAKGSYTALSCYYLTFIDESFAREQYERLKSLFLQKGLIWGFKEYHNKRCWLGFDIDAGPVIFNLSPTGTAFGLGSITYFNDYTLRNKFLTTAELAGSTVTKKNKRHYMLADVALVGEAITLAMRTAVKWD